MHCRATGAVFGMGEREGGDRIVFQRHRLGTLFGAHSLLGLVLLGDGLESFVLRGQRVEIVRFMKRRRIGHEEVETEAMRKIGVLRGQHMLVKQVADLVRCAPVELDGRPWICKVGLDAREVRLPSSAPSPNSHTRVQLERLATVH